MAYSRNEYLQSLNRMRANYQSQGNPLVNRENDDGNVGNELSSFAYMNTQIPEPEQASKGSEVNAYKRTIDTWTVGSLKANLTHGALNVVDDVVDFVSGAVGWFAGLFGANDVKKELQAFTQYDWQAPVEAFMYRNDWRRLLDGELFTSDYWTTDIFDAQKAREYVDTRARGSAWTQEIPYLQQIESGLGEILPSVALGIATGGASVGAQIGIQAGLAGLSGIGAGFEQATSEGADFDQAFGYGALKGAISAGTSAILMGIGGHVASKAGTGLAGKIVDKTVDKSGSVLLGKLAEAGFRATTSAGKTALTTAVEPIIRQITYDGNAIEKAYGSNEAVLKTLKQIGESAMQSAVVSASISAIQTGVDVVKAGGKTEYEQQYFNQRAIREANIQSELKTLQKYNESVEKLQKDLLNNKITEEQFVSKVKDLNAKHGEAMQSLNAKYSAWEDKNGLDNKIGNVKNAEMRQIARDNLGNMAREAFTKSPELAIAKIAKANGLSNEDTKKLLSDLGFFKGTGNKDIKVNADTGKMYLTVNNNGNIFQVPLKITGGGSPKISPTSGSEIAGAINVISSSAFASKHLPTKIEIKSSALSIPKTDLSNKLTLSKDVSTKIMNKANSKEIMNFLDNNKGKGKSNYVLQAKESSKYVVVEPFKDGNTQKYGTITIDKNTNEILDINVSKNDVDKLKYTLMPKDDIERLMSSKIENEDGSAKAFKHLEPNEMGGWLATKDGDGNGEFYVYSKNPLREVELAKKLPFNKIAKTFNIPTSLEKTYSKKLENKNPLSVIKFISRYAGTDENGVLEKLGFDAFEYKNGDVAFNNGANLISKGAFKYGQEKGSYGYSSIVKRIGRQSSHEELQGYIGENGRKLETIEDRQNYKRLVEENNAYVSEYVYNEDVKVVDKAVYTKDMQDITKANEKLGAETKFIIVKPNGKYALISGFFDNDKTIYHILNSDPRTFETRNEHEVVHYLEEAYHMSQISNVYDLLDIWKTKYPEEYQEYYNSYEKAYKGKYVVDEFYPDKIRGELLAEIGSKDIIIENQALQNQIIKTIEKVKKLGIEKATELFAKSIDDENFKPISTKEPKYTVNKAELENDNERTRTENQKPSKQSPSRSNLERLKEEHKGIREILDYVQSSGGDTSGLGIVWNKETKKYYVKNVVGDGYYHYFSNIHKSLDTADRVIVDLHDKDFYAKGKSLVREDGKAVGFIEKNGNIVSIAKNDLSDEGKGFTHDFLKWAIKNGGKYMDCMNSKVAGTKNLPYVYSKHGFVPVSKCKYSREIMLLDHTEEETNAFEAKFGQADLIFCAYSGTDENLYPSVEECQKAIDNLPYNDWDKAYEIQQQYVKKVSAQDNRPTEREIIKNSGSLTHSRIYDTKNAKDFVNSTLQNIMANVPNATKATIPTGKGNLENYIFKELNLYKDKDKAIENIVNEIENAVITFKNGENTTEKVVLKDLNMRNDLTNAVRDLINNGGDLSAKSKWMNKYIKTINRYAKYVHERAMLTSEYVNAIKEQKALTKIFDDTRAIKMGGENVVQEITLYRNMVKGFKLSNSEKNIAPSSFTNLVNNFKEYTPENYAEFYDATLKNVVNMLAESFEEGKFPDREPTLAEMKLFNAIRGRIRVRCKELASAKHENKIKTAEIGAKLASVGTPAVKPKKYGKIRNAIDSDVALPLYLRKYLGYDHPLVKHLSDTYQRVSANAIAKKNDFETYYTDVLSKEAGYRKYGALLKDLKKSIDYKIADRDGKYHKFTTNDVVGAYWVYKTNSEQLLSTGLTAYDERTKTNIDFKFTDDDYQKMFSKMPDKVRKWADLVFDKYFNGKDYDYKTGIVKKYFGISNLLDERKGSYAPTSRVGQTNIGIGASSQFDAGYLSTMLQGFLKGRVKNKNHFRWVSATDLLNQNAIRVAGWGEKAQWVEDLRVMLNTTVPSLGNHTLEYYLDKNIPEWKTTWSPYMTKIALGKDIVDQKGGLIEKVGNAGQVATLGFNFLGSVPKQTLSDFSWALDERVTWGMWLKTIPEAIGNFFKMGQTKKELMENNGYFIERFNHGDVVKAIMNGKLPNKISQTVLKPMEWLDSVVVSTHGYALAKQIVNKGIKDGTYTFKKGSKEYKEEVAHVLHGLTLISQSNSDPMYMSRLRSGDVSAIARDTLGRFHSDSQNKYQGLIEITEEKQKSDTRAKAYEEEANKAESEEERDFWKKQAENERKHFKDVYGKKVASFLAVIALNGLGATVISLFKRKLTGKEDWSNTDVQKLLTDSVLESTVNWLPYVGTIANAIENNSDVSAFTVDKLNNLKDTVKMVMTAFETGNETDIRKAIINLIKNGLELTGVPANNIYQLFMGIWYQLDKEGSLTAQNWVKGYSSSYMKSQYTQYLNSGSIDRAKAQLGAWSSMYSAPITDRATLNEIVRLSSAGYNVTPSGYATSYTDENGDKVSFTSAQANAFKTEYNKSSKVVAELLKVTDYKKADDKTKASMISKVYNAYRESAQAKATKIAPSSKLGKLLYYTNGDVNLAKYIASMQNLSAITGNNRKEKVISAINKMSGFTKQEKLLLAYLSGYSVSEKNQNQMVSYLVSKGFARNDAKNYLGIS